MRGLKPLHFDRIEPELLVIVGAFSFTYGRQALSNSRAPTVAISPVGVWILLVFGPESSPTGRIRRALLESSVEIMNVDETQLLKQE